ncbi:hypothetical protein L1987_01725 [Smallanthus sonchifolius]|uniref:Uncharacterized protein n=1 Tax=Smallanthus sonchifolius TaxID=185202 RepID=A0ACB9K626_9ASTR|nr:hypothetical protein L1987_01725 [Smallanthus sonchifolius]
MLRSAPRPNQRMIGRHFFHSIKKGTSGRLLQLQASARSPLRLLPFKKVFFFLLANSVLNGPSSNDDVGTKSSGFSGTSKVVISSGSTLSKNVVSMSVAWVLLDSSPPTGIRLLDSSPPITGSHPLLPEANEEADYSGL